VAARGYRDALAVARSANEMSGRADGGFIPIQRSTGSPSPAACIAAMTITQNTCVLVELGVDEAIPPKLQTEPDETAIPASSQRAGERRGGTLLMRTALAADRCHQSHRRRRRLEQLWNYLVQRVNRALGSDPN